MFKFKKECKKAEIKPIFGLEAYVAPESRFTKSKLDGHKKTSYHLTLLAKNEAGLRNLFRLTSIGWIDGFYYKPRIDREVLETHKEGLVVFSGCPAGRLSQYLFDGKLDEAKAHLYDMQELFKNDFYMEVQNHGFDWEQSLREALFEMSKYSGIPIVATQDSHYPEREDWEMHNAICKLAAGDLEFGTDQLYFKSREEMEEMFELDEHHALDITQEIADKCNCNWQHDQTIWPVFDLPDGKTPEEVLRELSYEGFKRLFGEGTKEYRDRLEYELKMIEQMGFPTYFLVVADFISWAKSQNIPVGPGRGSGAGSLVCYCTGITNVDPIKYGLYFERFLNPARVSLPDLDIDFCKERRGEVIEYVRRKYGADKVAQIGTYAVFKPRGSLRDFARVLGFDRGVGDILAAMVPPDDAGKALSFEKVIKQEPAILKTKWPQVVEFARKAEDLNKQAGVHAAGVIISNGDLKSQVPLFCGKSNEVTSQFDMNDVEDVGLVKYDFLGLKNLTVIQETIELVKKHRGVDIDIDAIDEHDQKVFGNAFQQGKLDGIFQFETSSGFRDLCIKVHPESIDDLSTITALFRPGPLETKLTDQYVEGRNGKTIEYQDERLRPILEPTYGVMTFQEQIMRICTDLAGYTLPEADNMRKIIGKKLREKMEPERKKFASGCIKNGVSESVATKMFDDISGFAKYCLAYDTLILTEEFGPMKIGEIVDNQLDCHIISIKNNFLVTQPIRQWHDNGQQEVFEYTLENGQIIQATKDHRFLTTEGLMLDIDTIHKENHRLLIVQ
jgi:DNA polymerase-3 subunit alpha